MSLGPSRVRCQSDWQVPIVGRVAVAGDSASKRGIPSATKIAAATSEGWLASAASVNMACIALSILAADQ